MLGDPMPDDERGANATSDADNDVWLDDDAGPLVRSFALTGGRARPAATLDLLAHVVATEGVEDVGPHLQPEHRALLAHASAPVSVVELASAVDLPIGVVRVLLGDLLELSAITVTQPASSGVDPGDHVLKAVISALRTL